MKVVIDTCVLVNAFGYRDDSACAAIVVVQRNRHEVAVCETLLHEYRNVLTRELPHLRRLVDTQLMMLKARTYADPVIRIRFGPEKDRMHMQLAIDVKAVEAALVMQLGNGSHHFSGGEGEMRCLTTGCRLAAATYVNWLVDLLGVSQEGSSTAHHSVSCIGHTQSHGAILHV